MEDAENDTAMKCAINLSIKNNQRIVGVAVCHKLVISQRLEDCPIGRPDAIRTEEEYRTEVESIRISENPMEPGWSFDLYEFLDNDQLSNTDCLLISLGLREVHLPDTLEDNGKPDARKMQALLRRREVQIRYEKKNYFARTELEQIIHKIPLKDTYYVNILEVLLPLYIPEI